MRLDEELFEYGSKAPVGRLIWDSEAGSLSGSAADRVHQAIERAVRAGGVGAGPQFVYDFEVSDPLHRPVEMAAVLAFAGFVLPKALNEVYPEFPDDEDVPDDAVF
jgi:hypothetical protein